MYIDELESHQSMIHHHPLPSPNPHAKPPTETQQVVTTPISNQPTNHTQLQASNNLTNQPHRPRPIPPPKHQVQPTCAIRTVVRAAQPATDQPLTTAAAALPNLLQTHPSLPSMTASQLTPQRSTRSHPPPLHYLSQRNHAVDLAAMRVVVTKVGSAADRFISWSA